MKRRDFAKTALLSGLAGGSALPTSTPTLATPAHAAPAESGRRLPWQNWSGGQRAQPSARLSPKTEDELAQVLRTAAGPIRPVGSGHSFSAVVPTDGTIISTRHFSGVEAAGELRAVVGAGTRLNQIGEPLHALGQALPNMPDVDEQTLAGALSTGTHGTGTYFGAMHKYLDALRLVTPRGDVLDCSRDLNPGIFDAARVSLGSLGVITACTLANVPTYKLRRRTWVEPLQQVLERFHELAEDHRNFEMYFIPHCDNALVITTDISDAPLAPRTVDADNDAVLQLKQARDYLSWWGWLRRKLLTAVSATIEPEDNVDWWWKIFPSTRAVRFNEMEYHLPREHIVAILRKVRERVEHGHPDVFFPIEVRVVQEDDAWLSPFYGRATASLAVHRFHAEDYRPYFAAIEPIYQPYEGRPHWGKLHTLSARELAARYPRWQDFQAVRRELDPEGKMLNTHLKQVFGDA